MGLLYTNKKIFHYVDKINSLPRNVETILPPLHIRLKPTNACNHNCYYCAYRSNDQQLGQDMRQIDFIPRDKMFELIDDFVDMGVKAITFSGGGEPFCYPHLLEAVKKLAVSQIRFASLTNGALLSGELAEVFAHHATWLRISMDGWDDKSYSEYRNCSDGEFRKIISNIKYFKSFGGSCYLGVSLIVDRKNAEHVFDFVKQMNQIGIDSVKISPCVTSNGGKENNDYHRPIFPIVKEQIQRAVNEFASNSFEVFDSYHSLSEKFAKTYDWCPYIQVLTVVGADLNIYSCQDKAYNLKNGLIGSIKYSRFKDVWYSDKQNFFRICPSIHCEHHCVSNEKNKMLIEYLDAEVNHLGFV